MAVLSMVQVSTSTLRFIYVHDIIKIKTCSARLQTRRIQGVVY